VQALCKAILVATMAMSFGLAHAQTKEAPPMEPPYTDDNNEFDPVQGEDPAATSTSPIPVSPTADPVAAPEKQTQNRPAEAAPSSRESSADYQKEYSNVRPNSKHSKGVQLLHHPDAKKGLMRIEQDGTYVYKVKQQKSDSSGFVRFGVMDPPQIEAADGIHNFANMYGSEGMFTVMAEYEWQPFAKYGKLGVQLGVGFATAEGNGFFENDPNTVPLEKYTFYAVPLNVGLVYRMEYFKRQWVAPYVSGGGTYIGVAELRDDDENHFSGTPGAYGAGGIMFNISSMDRNLAFELSNEYGVANLWLVAEYRYLQSFSEDLNFSGGIMSVGVGADF
jgi:hypothetical protein